MVNFVELEPSLAICYKIPDTKNTIFINDNPKEILELKKIFKKAKFIQISRIGGKKYNVTIDNIFRIHSFLDFK